MAETGFFDSSARQWDDNPVHWERSRAIAKAFTNLVPVKSDMTALEYGAGTGILSFLLSDRFSEITLMDNSKEMVSVMHEKISKSKIENLKPLYFDLETDDYSKKQFNCIYTQMVLHHVLKHELILAKFYRLLKDGGYLAIADLYAEDGSFHGEGFEGHNGFDVHALKASLVKIGFTHLATNPCFVINKYIEDTPTQFPIFLMVALK
jgi:tRNA (cmo5U34)-methyltransferase